MSSKYVPMCLFYLSNSVVPRLGRSIKKAFRSEVFREGAGFIVERYEKCFKNFYWSILRPIGGKHLNYMDPFLMLDHLGPVNNKPGEAVGAPWHPHR